MGTAQIVSTPGGLEAAREQQSCHKLVIGNWNITSLKREEHEQVDDIVWILLVSFPLGVGSNIF